MYQFIMIMPDGTEIPGKVFTVFLFAETARFEFLDICARNGGGFAKCGCEIREL